MYACFGFHYAHYELDDRSAQLLSCNLVEALCGQVPSLVK